MDQKIAVVTGANAGMGKATAVALARAGMHVVMVCRDEGRGQAALAAVRAESAGADVALMLCDLADLTDIRRFCDALRAAYPRVDVLVNNAGVLSPTRRETKDGLELHFGVCHIGHFLLTARLLDRMKAGARIVVVGSVAHKAGGIDFDDIGMRKGYTMARAYARAKLCNMLFTRALARRLEGTGVAVNCAHPGAVVTAIGANRGRGHDENTRLRRVAGRLLRPFLKTPAQGAATAVYLAASPAVEGVSGAYFADRKRRRPSKKAMDEALAERLWVLSEEIVREA